MATLEQELGRVLDDLGMYEQVPDHHHVHSYGPAVMHKIRMMLEHGIHQRHGASLGRLLHGWYNLLERHVHLAREARIWTEESNVVVSTPWDGVGAASSSSTVTLGAPYSGIPFMLLDILVPAELTPRGRLTNFTFAGINFANPSSQADVVQYNTTAPTGGTPATLGMDLTVFYSNKTSPIGRRGFRPWTGWIFDPSAKITAQVYNPDPTFSRSYDLAWLMRSSPCQNVAFDEHAWHARQDPRGQYHQAMNMIHTAILGLGQFGGVPHMSQTGGMHHAAMMHALPPAIANAPHLT